MHRGGWWAAVHGLAQLKRLSMYAHIFCKPGLSACFATLSSEKTNTGQHNLNLSTPQTTLASGGQRDGTLD